MDERYPNLAEDFEPIAPNQLWLSDITYIRLKTGFCYLSLITDAYSRKMGYKVRRDLKTLGCVAALRLALADNPARDGLIHHSDRGRRYYSTAYIKLLGPDIRVSMTENGDPLENAIAERVNGIFKVTPKTVLKAGEYGFYMLGTGDSIGATFYDFGAKPQP